MRVECTWRFVVSARTDEGTLEGEIDSVMDQLLLLEQADPRLSDAALALDLAQHHVEISLAIEAETVDEGVQQAMGAIRTAIHAAGGRTPEWSVGDESTLEQAWSLRHGELVVS